MSEERIVPDATEFASVASKTTVFWTNVFQSILVTVVVLWVLDIPRRVFGAGIYLEQVLTVSLGLTLARSHSLPRPDANVIGVTGLLLLLQSFCAVTSRPATRP